VTKRDDAGKIGVKLRVPFEVRHVSPSLLSQLA
jgi:hypothetical protein